MADKAWYGAAEAYERQGDLWAAVGTLKQLAAVHPQSELAAQGTLKSSDFLVSQGRGEEAKAELMKMLVVVQAEPTRSQAQKKLGEILKAEGHLREAAVYFQEALKKAPPESAAELQAQLNEIRQLQGMKQEN